MHVEPQSTCPRCYVGRCTIFWEHRSVILFLDRNDRGCPKPPMFGDSIYGEHMGALVRNADGAWEPGISRSPWLNLPCDDDVWLREQATMNRAQNSFVDEQWVRSQIQPSYEDSCCYFADYKNLQLRPASMYDLSNNSRVCITDLRGSPARGFEFIRQGMKTTPPYMVIVQHDDDSLSDEAIKALCDLQENQGGYFLFNTRGRTSDHNPNWESSRGFFGDKSPSACQVVCRSRRRGSSSLRNCQTCGRGRNGICHRSISKDRIGSTMGRKFFLQLGQLR